jgi:diguanylate cyclase (GGDEF)-like protein/PAS domain S-box-containing protein
MTTDNTSLKQLLEQYKNAVDISMIVSKTDPSGTITFANDQFIQISKYDREELIGKKHNIIRHPDMPQSAFKDLWETIQAKKVWKGIVKNLAKDGTAYYVDTVIMPILDENENIIEYIGLRNNITPLLETQQLLEKARIDEVTHLKSRTALLEDKDLEVNNNLALIDVASFKYINDFYGHIIGDSLLQVISRELQKYTKDFNCNLYRLPVDIFAILTQEPIEELEKLVHEFSQYISSRPITIASSHIYVNVVSGLAGYQSKHKIYQYADVALQYAKSNKKRVQVYSKEINSQKEIESNLLWTQRLNEAIFDNKLKTFYQPIVDNKTLQYTKYESLVRLIDENGNIVSPFYFLNISKQTKLYSYLTKKVLEDTLEMFRDKDINFSINLSIEDFENEKTVQMLLQVFQDKEVAQKATLEITETEEMNNYATVTDVISKLKGLGCKIAIDDFGSGYSNFTYLMKLKADFIKIDGTLIEKIDHDFSSQSIVKAIVSFAQEMGIKTIAEYVSSEEIFQKVQKMGIDYSQGYYFGIPKETL